MLVHDAARPFPRTSLIDRVLAAARRGVGAVPAVAVADTVKELDATQQQRVARTVPRDRLVRAQTPQGFPVEFSGKTAKGFPMLYFSERQSCRPQAIRTW